MRSSQRLSARRVARCRIRDERLVLVDLAAVGFDSSLLLWALRFVV